MRSEEKTTKMRVVDCAVRLFKEKGYSNVSVSEICKLSGITRSAFYYHFKSKDEILDDYFLMPEVLVSENLASILASANYFDQFYTIFEIYMKRTTEAGPDIFGQILKRNIDKDLHTLSPHDIAMWDIYVTLIQKAQAHGEIKNPMPAELLVEAIVYLADGVALIWCNKKGSFDYIAEYRRMLEALVIPADAGAAGK
jgi:AcrR family transcriptional regulator